MGYTLFKEGYGPHESCCSRCKIVWTGLNDEDLCSEDRFICKTCYKMCTAVVPAGTYYIARKPNMITKVCS